MNRWAETACLLPLGILVSFGCNGGGGGGTGGVAGAGGGTGGMGGEGGQCGGYGGGVPIECITPPETVCQNTSVEPVDPCCEPPAPPTQEDACVGDESLENPPNCTPSGPKTAYRLTSLKVAADCNIGFNLDACNGVTSCNPRPMASEGLGGVDNALATTDHGGINQLFVDAICGSTRAQGPDCETAIPKLDIELAIEVNALEQCANVTISASGSEVGSKILNLSDTTPAGTRCVSGWLGPIPLALGNAEIVLESWAVRMTVSDSGFSDGLLGATLDTPDALSLAEAAIPNLGADIEQHFDISADLHATWCACDALSATFEIGGVAQPTP
jgi:hypothetical protein